MSALRNSSDIFRRNLAAWRKYQKLTPRELAEKSGLQPQTITRIESGETQSPALHIIETISAALGHTAGAMIEDRMYEELEDQFEDPAKGPDGISMIIAENTAFWRKNRGLSQTVLGRRTGVGQSEISRIEGGTTQSPGIEMILRIAQGLDIPVEALLRPPGIAGERLDSVLKEHIAAGLEDFLASEIAKSLALSSDEKDALAELRWYNPAESPTHMDWADWVRLRRRVCRINGD